MPQQRLSILLKPGAEKLCHLFRCTPIFKLEERVENWDLDKPFFRYLWSVEIRSRALGEPLAYGYGEANSLESRYRWRWAKTKCPLCEQETVYQSKKTTGWYCGSCKEQFPDPKDQRITGQKLGRIPNDDVFSSVNALVKIGKKRALVDGTLALARCSDLFTQDTEEDDVEPPEPHSGDDWVNQGMSSAHVAKDTELRAAIAACASPVDIMRVAERIKAEAPDQIKPALRSVWEHKRSQVAEADVERQKAEQAARQSPPTPPPPATPAG